LIDFLNFNNVQMRYNIQKTITANKLLGIAIFALLFTSQQLSAQNRPGGNKSGAQKQKPALNKPAAKKPAAQKPAAQKPAAAKSAAKKPDQSRSVENRTNANNNDNAKRTNVNNSGNKTNNLNGGNKVNIDNSKKNVNINVDKSRDIHVNNNRNTVVRRNPRPYSRPPMVYGGRRYRCYNPFVFHPYRPFVWGPRWHPWGFFVATLATTAIIVSIVDNDMDMPGDFDMASNDMLGTAIDPEDNMSLRSGPAFMTYAENQEFINNSLIKEKLTADGDHYYDEGVFYLKGNGGYTVVSAPLGAKVKTLPSGYETVTIDDKGTKNYYYGGAFYEKRSDGYVVVAPVAGTIVERVSEGGEEVKMGEITYVKLGETFFQPIRENGKDMYEVADVEDDK
jgi:hypothetical protein